MHINSLFLSFRCTFACFRSICFQFLLFLFPLNVFSWCSASCSINCNRFDFFFTTIFTWMLYFYENVGSSLCKYCVSLFSASCFQKLTISACLFNQVCHFLSCLFSVLLQFLIVGQFSFGFICNYFLFKLFNLCLDGLLLPLFLLLLSFFNMHFWHLFLFCFLFIFASFFLGSFFFLFSFSFFLFTLFSCKFLLFLSNPLLFFSFAFCFSFGF